VVGGHHCTENGWREYLLKSTGKQRSRARGSGGDKKRHERRLSNEGKKRIHSPINKGRKRRESAKAGQKKRNR